MLAMGPSFCGRARARSPLAHVRWDCVAGAPARQIFLIPTVLQMDLAKSRADRFRRFLAIRAAGDILWVHA
jgi:hypothetical protein